MKAASRWLIAAVAFVLCTSFSRPGKLALEPGTAAEGFRVSRHVAAGIEYLVVEPEHTAAGAELPMVVYIHGRGGMPSAPTENLFGIRRDIRLILPRGPEPFSEGFAWMPVSAHRGESAALVTALRARSERLNQALGHWRRRHPTRGRPIVVGFSQGGMLTAQLALKHPESMAAAFPVAGWVPPSLMPNDFDPYAARVPVFAMHGADDEILDEDRSERVFDRLQHLGYPVRYESFVGARHELTAEMRERLRTEIEAAIRRLPDASRHVPSS